MYARSRFPHARSPALKPAPSVAFRMLLSMSYVRGKVLESGNYSSEFQKTKISENEKR